MIFVVRKKWACLKEWRWFINNVRINCFVKLNLQSKIPLECTSCFNSQIIQYSLQLCQDFFRDLVALYRKICRAKIEMHQPPNADSRGLKELFTLPSRCITVEYLLYFKFLLRVLLTCTFIYLYAISMYKTLFTICTIKHLTSFVSLCMLL